MLRPYRGVAARVHSTAFIDASAQIIGDVYIGEEGDDIQLYAGRYVQYRLEYLQH